MNKASVGSQEDGVQRWRGKAGVQSSFIDPANDMEQALRTGTLSLLGIQR